MVLRRDPCGFICIFITYAAVIYADYAVTYHMILGSMAESPWAPVNIAVFNTLLLMLVVSHLRAVTCDPGMVPLPTTRLDFSHLHSGKSRPGMDGWTVCGKCQTYRPPRSHHCRICGRCIRKMDHHCPWINNCVGEFNQKFFIMFLFYVGLSSLYAICMIAVYWLSHTPFPPSLSHEKDTKLAHTIILVVECLLFLLFVVAIGCDQACAIMSDATLIEQLKKEGGGRKLSTREACSEVFGNMHPALWLIPFNISSRQRTLHHRPIPLRDV